MRLLAIGLVLISLSACTPGRYVAENVDIKSPDNYAVVQVDPKQVNTLAFDNYRDMVISKVDGKRTFNWFYLGLPREVYVGNGWHKIEVEWTTRNGLSKACLTAKLKRGNVYTIMTKIEGYFVKFWLKDEMSGSVLGVPCEANNFTNNVR